MAEAKARLDRHGDVAVLTLDDAATRNALSWPMADALRKKLTELGDARALVITGAGKGFCSGGDLTMEGAGQEGFGDVIAQGIADAVNPLMLDLAALQIPVISCVNGAAAGAGASLALSADFVIAGESAFFLFAFPKVGLALDAGASWILPRLIGNARATQALMLAERISAQQAADWNMIYRVAPDEDLLDEGMQLATTLAAGPTIALGQIRQSMRSAQHSTYAAALDAEKEAQRLCGNTQDCREAVAAFTGKRAPQFTGN